MPLHFAAAENRMPARLSRAQARAVLVRPANDNDNAEALARQDQVLKAALHHFAKHGMQAAQNAHHEAERAFFAGNQEHYAWWRDICRTLDRRLARSLTSKTQRG